MRHLPRGSSQSFLKDVDTLRHERQELERLGAQLGLKSMEDWYQITPKSIMDLGGQELVQKYKSLFQMVRSVFPEHVWHQDRFPRVPRGYWRDLSHQRSF